MILGAGSRSNSALSSASSSSWSWGTGRAGGSTRKLISRPPARPTCPSRSARSHAGAFADPDLGLVGTRLVVVDVELGALVRRGELVEILELGGDGLGATRAVHPLPERLTGHTLVCKPPDDPDRGLRGPLGRQPQRLVAEVDLLLAHMAAQEHLVAGG